jgi:hypothetical protein
MTEHPITPSRELVSKWCYEDGEEIKSSPRWFFSVCAKAAQWGADQELDACCEWLVSEGWFKYEHEAVEDLRTARRPKPPSLKDRALQAWAVVEAGTDDQTAMAVIRRALEQLDD